MFTKKGFKNTAKGFQWKNVAFILGLGALLVVLSFFPNFLRVIGLATFPVVGVVIIWAFVAEWKYQSEP